MSFCIFIVFEFSEASTVITKMESHLWYSDEDETLCNVVKHCVIISGGNGGLTLHRAHKMAHCIRTIIVPAKYF